MKRKSCVMRAATLVLTVMVLFSQLAGTAFAETEGDRIKQRLKEIQEQLASINDTIASLEGNVDNAEALRQSYQEKKNTIETQIALRKQDIALQETALEEKQQEVEQKVLDVANARKAFAARLGAMYMSHNDSSLATLLGVSTFSEAVSYAQYTQSISENDKKIIENLREQQTELEAQTAEVQTMLDELNTAREELEADNEALNASIEKATADIAAAQQQIEANQAAQAALTQEQKDENAKWAAWIAQDDASGFVFDGALFSWPLPGYFRLSSGFNEIRQGISGSHSGIDIPAPCGTPIYAAAAGRVSTTAHWSYGTCVKVSIGSGMVNVYGHMSARAAGITDGVWVEKGQVIGYVGSTGRSTGNHLHFEVDINGKFVDPKPYFSAETLAQLYR